MTDEILRPRVIESAPFPNELESSGIGSVTQTSGGNSIPNTTQSVRMPTRIIAHEVISSTLNTKSKKILGELEFEQKGAFQIGKYVPGVSGDIRMTSTGIVMRDKDGTITVAQYAEDGSAVFKGSIQAGSIITGLLALGNNSIVLDGEAVRMVFYDNANGKDRLPVIVIGNA